MNDEPQQASEGGGVLDDPHRAGADARMLSRAVRERWPIPGDKRELITKKLADMASSDHPRAASAAKTLANMDRLNQADEHADRHYDRIDDNKPTDLVRFDGVDVKVPEMPR